MAAWQHCLLTAGQLLTEWGLANPPAQGHPIAMMKCVAIVGSAGNSMAVANISLSSLAHFYFSSPQSPLLLPFLNVLLLTVSAYNLVRRHTSGRHL